MRGALFGVAVDLDDRVVDINEQAVRPARPGGRCVSHLSGP